MEITGYPLTFPLTPPLPPLISPSHFQHVDVAALLIKYDSPINAIDRWNFTPLHEAAQKGRTQLCSLLILHGADVNMKNQEGQIPCDLATVSDIKCFPGMFLFSLSSGSCE